MRIQIDTQNKTIRIEEQVKLTELYSIVKKLLPNNEWKEYSLEQLVITNWWNPIYINRADPYPFPVPYYGSTGVSLSACCNGNATTSVVSVTESNNVFNIEMN